MGPGILVFFPIGETAIIDHLQDPFQVPLNVVKYKNAQLSIASSVNISLRVTKKLEYSMKVIK